MKLLKLILLYPPILSDILLITDALSQQSLKYLNSRRLALLNGKGIRAGCS